MAAGVAPPVAGARADVHVTGRRILATVVDGLVFGLFWVVMAALLGTISTEGPFNWEGTLPAVPTVIYALAVVFYYILMEGYLGHTLGKMLLGIKVVREDTGEVPGLGAATIRTLLRIVDGLFSYLVAYVAVLVSDERQRLGDMAAHTLVVRK